MLLRKVSLSMNGIVAGSCLNRILVEPGMLAVEEMLWVCRGAGKDPFFPRVYSCLGDLGREWWLEFKLLIMFPNVIRVLECSLFPKLRLPHWRAVCLAARKCSLLIEELAKVWVIFFKVV